MPRKKNYSKNRRQRQAERLAMASQLGMPHMVQVRRAIAHNPDHAWNLVDDFLTWATSIRQPGWSFSTWRRHVQQEIKDR